MAPKTKGGKGKRSRKAPSAEPELPADLADIMRPDGDDIEDEEVAGYVNDTIAQFFEDRPYFYDTSHEGSMIAFTHESHSNVHMRSLPIYYRGPRGSQTCYLVLPIQTYSLTF